jgi:ferredoxin-NADP reductase
MKLKLIHKEKIANDSWELMFEKPEGMVYEPGQYLEVSIDHPNKDDRGITRWFTMSSSPTEGDIMITTRLVEKHSTFKEALFGLEPGDEIEAKGPMGKFLLPKDPGTPIVWIAGGIGVTPFRAQLKFLLDNGQNRDITLIYSNRTEGDICFTELWRIATEQMSGFKLVSTLVDQIPSDWKGEKGMVDEPMIKRAVGDVAQKEFYVSGPEPMVEAFKPKLLEMGVEDKKIHQDWFPNYTDEFFKV